ncbi:MAG: helix-turn-helix domain-containing protein [Candidatus Thermoplasmatota archaeon]
MNARTAGLTGLVALLLIPAASAGLPTQETTVGSTALDDAGGGSGLLPPLPSLDVVPGGTLPVQIEVESLVSPRVSASVAVTVGVAPEATPVPAGLDPTGPSAAPEASTPASPAPAGMPVVVPATAAFLLLAVGVLTTAFKARLLGWLARGVRLLALVGLLPAALFSRIERGSLLENPVRARVHDAVAHDPGVSLTEVQSRAGIAWGTAVHHLRRLESNGLIVSVSQSAHRRYFIADTPAAAHRSALAAIRQPTARRIAELVLRRPGIDQSGLCQELALNSPAASKHLGQFRKYGLVLSQRVGRRTIHHPTPVLEAALRLLPTPSVESWETPAPAAAMPARAVLVAG